MRAASTQYSVKTRQAEYRRPRDQAIADIAEGSFTRAGEEHADKIGKAYNGSLGGGTLNMIENLFLGGGVVIARAHCLDCVDRQRLSSRYQLPLLH